MKFLKPRRKYLVNQLEISTWGVHTYGSSTYKTSMKKRQREVSREPSTEWNDSVRGSWNNNTNSQMKQSEKENQGLTWKARKGKVRKPKWKSTVTHTHTDWKKPGWNQYHWEGCPLKQQSEYVTFTCNVITKIAVN